jgi:hypothetical protein
MKQNPLNTMPNNEAECSVMPHIDPAGCTRYTGIQCEYEGALGAM